MRSGRGRSTVICFITWKPGCFASYASCTRKRRKRRKRKERGMSMRRMRAEPHVCLRAAAALSLVLCIGLRIDGAVAQVSERATATTVEPHTTLEDPFNRAFFLDRLEARDGGANLVWDARFWAGYTFDKLLLR